MPELQTLEDILRRFESAGGSPAVLALEEHGLNVLSYAELSRAASRIADAVNRYTAILRAPVALIGPNSPDWILAFWGIVAAGQIVMPLDAQCSDQDLAHMLQTSGCTLAVAASSSAERLRAIASSCRVLTFDEAVASENSSPEPIQRERPAPLSASDTAILLFTSGTTGTPKAVPLTHANLLANVRALLTEGVIQTGDHGLIPLPLHHGYPLTVGMLTLLAQGATLVLPSGVSGPELVEAIQRGRVTILLGVPRLYETLFNSVVTRVARRRGFAARTFPLLLKLCQFLQRRVTLSFGRLLFRGLRKQLGNDLRIMVCGGAAISVSVEEGLDALGWEMLTGYGLTETSPILCFNRHGQSRVGSVGRALPGIELLISEPDAGGVGEIQVRGASVFGGYKNDPAATRGAFTADGWFKTGDLGRLDRDGYLTVVGRLNETIVLPDGRKLLLETVEAAYAAVPIFREIAALPSASGLVALVVPNFETIREAGATRIEDLIRETLDAHARTLPSHYRFTGFAILREPLPRTALGKIRRGRIRALYEAAHAARPRIVPQRITPEDALLLEDSVGRSVWQWLQARYKERALDLDTSPQLDLGIDSLGWIEFTFALEHDLGISLTEREITRIVTLRDLLRHAISASARTAKPSGLTAEQVKWLATLGWPSLLARHVGEALVRLSVTLAFSLRVEGRERLPDSGPFLLCPNHSSYLDAFVVAAALPHRHLRATYWAGWTGILFQSRLRRLFSRLAYVIPVDPDRALAANIELSALTLAKGHNLVWFAEGAMSSDGSLHKFLPGVGALLERNPVPVVPVLISGTHAALRPGKNIPSFCPVRVRFGRVLDSEALVPSKAGRKREQHVADAIHDAVAQLEYSAE